MMWKTEENVFEI